MRVTIDIRKSDLKKLRQLTGQKGASTIVICALADFLRTHDRRVFVERVLTGKTDYPFTNEEIEDRDCWTVT